MIRKTLDSIAGTLMIELTSLIYMYNATDKTEIVDYPGYFNGEINDKIVRLNRENLPKLTTLLIKNVDRESKNNEIYYDENNDGTVDVVINNGLIINKIMATKNAQSKYNDYLTKIYITKIENDIR